MSGGKVKLGTKGIFLLNESENYTNVKEKGYATWRIECRRTLKRKKAKGEFKKPLAILVIFLLAAGGED